MAEVQQGTSSETITETVQIDTPPPPQQEGRSLTIKLRKRKTDKKVEWSSDTVDNEHLGRRSSKCCCVYEKPRQFGESSSESEGDDDEGCGSAHCILGHGKDRHGQIGGGGSALAPPSSGGGSHTHWCASVWSETMKEGAGSENDNYTLQNQHSILFSLVNAFMRGKACLGEGAPWKIAQFVGLLVRFKLAWLELGVICI